MLLMDPLFGLGCLIIYVVGRFLGGGPKYVNSDTAKNFRKMRNDALGDVGGLKEVKKIKRNCFKK